MTNKPNNPGIYSTEAVHTDAPEVIVSAVINDTILRSARGTIVSKNAETALVTWDDDGKLRRGYVPLKSIVEGMVKESILDMAIPYGVDWSDFPEIPILQKDDLIEQLHRRGVWSVTDMRSNVQEVQAAIIEIAGIALVKILEYANSKEA